MQAKRLPRLTAIFLVKAYQNILSFNMLHSCRFIPSCSGYAVQTLERHGLILGSWKALRRILHCRPFVPGGYDPVGVE